MLASKQKRILPNQLTREAEYFDSVVVTESKTHALLARFAKGFYEKGERGRLWAPIWETNDLRRARILDYGCGYGRFSDELGSRGAYVRGVETSRKSSE